MHQQWIQAWDLRDRRKNTPHTQLGHCPEQLFWCQLFLIFSKQSTMAKVVPLILCCQDHHYRWSNIPGSQDWGHLKSLHQTQEQIRLIYQHHPELLTVAGFQEPHFDSLKTKKNCFCNEGLDNLGQIAKLHIMTTVLKSNGFIIKKIVAGLEC